MKMPWTHDLLSAFDHLAREGIAHSMSFQRISGKRGREVELAVAAVAFTAQVSIEYGYDVETIRAMERDLIEKLENDR